MTHPLSQHGESRTPRVSGSQFQAFSGHVRDEMYDLVNHLKVISAKNKVNMLNYTISRIQNDLQVLFIPICHIGQNPCCLKLKISQIGSHRCIIDLKALADYIQAIGHFDDLIHFYLVYVVTGGHELPDFGHDGELPDAIWTLFF